MDNITSNIFFYIVIVFSLSIHEYSHAFVANELGDPTAKQEGRLTLNPLSHIDPIGTVLIPLFLMLTSGAFFGWAKPVPFNPSNISDPKGEFKIALAGPASNLIIAFIISAGLLIIDFIPYYHALNKSLMSLIGFVIYINIFLALFNLIPIPPLDGSKVLGIFLPSRIKESFFSIGPIGFIAAIFIGMLIVPFVADIVFSLFYGFWSHTGYILSKYIL